MEPQPEPTAVEPVSTERLLEAYAKSLAVYYAAEKAFMEAPTPERVFAYHAAVERFRGLGRAVRAHADWAEALLGTERDESVGR